MAELKPDPQNARRHPARNKELIRQSLEDVGAGRSILVDGDGIIRAGNGVFEQAEALGLKIRQVEAAPDELIAVVRPDLTGEKAERAALYDNQAGDLSEWDLEVIKLLADERPEVVEGIIDQGDLAAMLEEGEDLEGISEAMQGGGKEEQPVNERLGNERAKIRPVLYSPQLKTFELALRATKIENRGEALIEICRFYLEKKHGLEEAG